MGVVAIIGSPTAAHATFVNEQCPLIVRNASTNEQVTLCQAFDFVANGLGYTVAGYGELGGYQGIQNYPATGVHVQIDRVNLGTPSGVIASGGPANGQNGFIAAYTGRVNYDCVNEYRVRVYFSIRWSNGTLTSNVVGPLTRLPECTTPTVPAVSTDVVVPQVMTVS